MCKVCSLLVLISFSCLLGCNRKKTEIPNTCTPVYLDISKRAANAIDSVVGSRKIADAYIFEAGTDSMTGMPKIGITLTVTHGNDTVNTELVRNSNRFLRLKRQTVPVGFPMEVYLYDPKDHYIREKSYNLIVLYLNINRELIGVEDRDKLMHEK